MSAPSAILRAHHVPGVDPGDADAVRALVATCLLGPVLPVIAVAVAVVFRSTAAALITVLALNLAPAGLGMLPGWWQRNVLSLFPGSASDSIATGHLDASDLHVHPLAAVLVVAAWIAASLTLARAVLLRRDA